jgi:isopropylmalate/homocitrate/citramalate synthase
MRDITIVEVSPRDGLQNESEILSTDAKVDLITRLVDAGARRIEAVSFAHPKLVPAMADAEAVMARVPRRDDVSYAGLILNRKGLDRAVGAGVDEVNVVVCVSDTFSGRNQNVTADEAMRWRARSSTPPGRRASPPRSRWRPRSAVRSRARSTRRGWRSSPGAARTPACRSWASPTPSGSGRRDRSPTSRRGCATPSGSCRCASTSTTPRNTGFANAYAAVAEGVDVLDASAGGIGGCPFAPKATGNIATDDLVYMLERMGHRTGIDLATLLPTAAFLGEQLGHEVPALLPRAGAFP